MAKYNLGRAIRLARDWRLRPEILLDPQIPRPMHGTAPRIVLSSQWWSATKRTAMRTTNYHCVACGVHRSNAKVQQWLEGHERYRINYGKGRLYYLETVPLCYCCHRFIHLGQLEAMLINREIDVQAYLLVVRHGELILEKNGLKRKDRQPKHVAAWGKWRLVVNGEEYPPVLRSEHEWSRRYRRPFLPGRD